jgi:glycosyltransferase involved in cell wall biosynthesis
VNREPRGPGRGFVLGGRLVRHKAAADGARAWRLAGTSHPLLVAGEGPPGPDADALEGAERFGWLVAEALRSVLRGSRALLFPALWQEPFGILAVEALAEGTPVIAAESGGTEEWSAAGCLTAPRGDVDAMAAAIRRLADDPALARRLGDAGRAFVAARFDRAALEPRLLALYAKVASG